jgi:hypothetical protein
MSRLTVMLSIMVVGCGSSRAATTRPESPPPPTAAEHTRASSEPDFPPRETGDADKSQTQAESARCASGTLSVHAYDVAQGLAVLVTLP